jgi:hypothetical protein
MKDPATRFSLRRGYCCQSKIHALVTEGVKEALPSFVFLAFSIMDPAIVVVNVDITNMHTGVVAGLDVTVAVSGRPAGPDRWFLARGSLWQVYERAARVHRVASILLPVVIWR